MNNGIQNILVVRTDRIGDVVLTTPALALLRRAYPAAKISLLVSPLTKDLVEGNPDIDEVLVDERKRLYRGVGFLRLVSDLRRRKFDLAVIYHTKKRTNVLCFMAGIPRRIGYKNNKFGFLLTHPVSDERHQGLKHEAQYCVDLLKTLGVEGEIPPAKVSLLPEAQYWAAQKLQKIPAGSHLIAVHLGASDNSKCWPIEHFAGLMAELQQKYNPEFVLLGAQNTVEKAQALQKRLSFPVLDLTGQTSVAELCAVLNCCRMLISNDSGPVHIADALQLFVVSIFTRNQPGINPERWRPLNPKNRAVFPAPGGSISFADPRRVNPVDMNFLPVKAVFESVDSLYKLC